MKGKLLDYIGCQECGGEFQVRTETREGDEILEGKLECRRCSASYPIVRGVPRFAAGLLDDTVRSTIESFGFEWRYFSDKLCELKEDREFLTLIPPVTPQFFEGKVVLDVGCGMGRLSYLSGSYGAREVIGVDLSHSVDPAFSYTRNAGNVHIMQCDLHHIPLRKEVDFAFSLGVLHHIPSGVEGLKSICRHVKKEGGTVAFWVYGKEGNEIMRTLQFPFRILTTRLSRHTNISLSKLLTHFLSGVYRGVYMPLQESALDSLLFYKSYFRYFHTLSFHDRQSTVFDFLSTRIVRYYSYKDIIAWIRAAGLERINIYHRNSNSWGVVAVYARSSAPPAEGKGQIAKEPK